MLEKISLPWWEGLKEGEKTGIKYEVSILAPPLNLPHQGRKVALSPNSTVLAQGRGLPQQIRQNNGAGLLLLNISIGILINTGGKYIQRLYPENLFRGPYISYTRKQFIKIITSACLFQPAFSLIPQRLHWILLRRLKRLQRNRPERY
jgi:hypothetical protein